MNHAIKVRQGTREWFGVVGRLMVDHREGLMPDVNLSLVERYTDGVEFETGLIQGIRFDIRNGVPTFRVGVGRDEHGDVTVEVTAAAARTLNIIHSDDPAYDAARARILASGEMLVVGDASPLNAWLEGVHDMVVERTA